MKFSENWLRTFVNPPLSTRDLAQALTMAGVEVESIEPAAFALLAWLRAQRRTGNLPETTGASRPMLLGQITEPTPG